MKKYYKECRPIRINIHIYPTPDFQFESRILKETETIASMHTFDQIILVGYGGTGTAMDESLDETRRIWRVPLRRLAWAGKRLRRVFHYLCWAFQISKRFSKDKPAMVNSHSIFDLPIGVILKKLTGCLLIYDAHELETERNGMNGILKKILKKIEKLAMKHVDHLFLPTPSIAQWYKNQYQLENITQIYNVPKLLEALPAPARIFREKFRIPDDEIIFLYQGAFMNGRGIPLLLAVFSRIDRKKHILFMGYGALAKLIKEYSGNFSNIHFHKAVHISQLRQFTAGADIGLSIIENICLSYYYSLPNKVFEYLLSGLPCVVSDFPDMAELVDTYRCGWKTEVTENAIFDLLNKITRVEIESKRAGIVAVRNQFNWENEELKIVPVYQKLLSK
jgi:glycosyltransferase involved in cell wall biosynthesis